MSLKRLLLLVILLRHSVGFIANRRISRARLCGKKGWSEQEDALLVIAQDRWGAKAWERIAEVLPERTEREIRSRAKWRKTVKVPKNSGFSEFGARALGGFREEAATRATAIVDAADFGRAPSLSAPAAKAAKAPPAKQAAWQPPKFEMPKFDVGAAAAAAAELAARKPAAEVGAPPAKAPPAKRPAWQPPTFEVPEADVGAEAAAAEAAAAADAAAAEAAAPSPRAAEEVVPAVAPEAAAPATGDGPAYSEDELRGMFASVAGGDDRAALADVARAPYIAGLLDEGDITRAELSELFGRAPKALAADWQEVEDPSSGNPYYWNTRTSETTWERPIGDVIDAGGFVWLSAAIEDLFED